MWGRKVLIVLFGIASCMPLAVADELGTDRGVSRDELLAYLADPTTFTLIDARSAPEFAAGHVAGALSVPHDDLAAHLAALPADRAAPLTVYCRTGKRARLLAEALLIRGYTNVRVLQTSQLFWADGLVVFNCGGAAGDASDRLQTGADGAIGGTTYSRKGDSEETI